MIELQSVALVRGDRPVLHGLDLFASERRVGVIGANGSGKSSFARLLNGLLLPSTGHVRIAGLDTAADGRLVRRRVGFLFQNPDNQIVYPTVGEDVAFGLKRRKLAREEVRDRVAAALVSQALGGFEDRLVHELSGGERQRVALAGVLVMEPDLLVLDEPTTLLDLRSRRAFMRTIDAIGQTVVMVTHDLDLVAGFDRVLCFDHGRLVADGPPGGVIEHYRRLSP